MAKQDTQKNYAHLKEYWSLEHLKMERTNPTAKEYKYGMNAATDNDISGTGPDIATNLRQCANAMMAG